MKNTPNTMVGFRASGTVTKEEFDKIVLPSVAELVQRTGKLNYLLELDTELKNFTLGAWLKDAMLGLNNIMNWNRCAIVSNSEAINTFTNIFSKAVPGEFRGFKHEELEEAIEWVSGKKEEAFQEEAKPED